ncbi:hypothetical protein SDC9_207375 [bioreactor metagenome]|uniref:Uncharacterized protein n=1 Tax=bioreactor metagenome TaxID=1076179 RepID=A0A645JJ42_9ZZZZ
MADKHPLSADVEYFFKRRAGAVIAVARDLLDRKAGEHRAELHCVGPAVAEVEYHFRLRRQDGAAHIFNVSVGVGQDEYSHMQPPFYKNLPRQTG